MSAARGRGPQKRAPLRDLRGPSGYEPVAGRDGWCRSMLNGLVGAQFTRGALLPNSAFCVPVRKFSCNLRAIGLASANVSSCPLPVREPPHRRKHGDPPPRPVHPGDGLGHSADCKDDIGAISDSLLVALCCIRAGRNPARDGAVGRAENRRDHPGRHCWDESWD